MKETGREAVWLAPKIYPVRVDGETVKRLDIYPCMRCFLAVEDVC